MLPHHAVTIASCGGRSARGRRELDLVARYEGWAVGGKRDTTTGQTRAELPLPWAASERAPRDANKVPPIVETQSRVELLYIVTPAIPDEVAFLKIHNGALDPTIHFFPNSTDGDGAENRCPSRCLCSLTKMALNSRRMRATWETTTRIRRERIMMKMPPSLWWEWPSPPWPPWLSPLGMRNALRTYRRLGHVCCAVVIGAAEVPVSLGLRVAADCVMVGVESAVFAPHTRLPPSMSSAT
ncbi:hypothetical protein GUJ93_ZPchr0006g41966 [Zizania palustris]|uniref:Uncharacterized protein n=1 Tax=Zizania palustris TaxID=103762 RepID=A0A8J5TDH2_ZIZPA|nr:hypothetical protein GUJ93_ZPchr0006g41966 [Zizania palustris]